MRLHYHFDVPEDKNVGVVVDTDEELPLAPAAVLAVTT